MVTVTVTSHKITEKDKEDSEKMITYNMCNIYIDLKTNTWLFRVG